MHHSSYKACLVPLCINKFQNKGCIFKIALDALLHSFIHVGIKYTNTYTIDLFLQKSGIIWAYEDMYRLKSELIKKEKTWHRHIPQTYQIKFNLYKLYFHVKKKKNKIK